MKNLLLLILLVNCTYVYSIKEKNSEPGLSSAKSPVRLIVLYEKLDGFKSAGWEPIEFLESGAAKYGTTSLIQKYPLAYFIRTNAGKDFNRKLIYTHLSSMEDYERLEKKNLIIVKPSQQSEWNVFRILTYATLGVIPSYNTDDMVFQTEIYDEKGNKKSKEIKIEKISRSWMGWIFFIWGFAASDSSEEIMYDSIKAALSSPDI